MSCTVLYPTLGKKLSKIYFLQEKKSPPPPVFRHNFPWYPELIISNYKYPKFFKIKRKLALRLEHFYSKELHCSIFYFLRREICNKNYRKCDNSFVVYGRLLQILSVFCISSVYFWDVKNSFLKKKMYITDSKM